MKRRNYRKRQENFLTIIEGICFVAFWVSLACMDSQDITIPLIALIVSAVGMFTSFKLEERRKQC